MEGGTPKRTNHSEAGNSKLFCGWLTKQSPGGYSRVYSCTVKLCSHSQRKETVCTVCTAVQLIQAQCVHRECVRLVSRCTLVQQTEPFKVYACVMRKCHTGVHRLDKITNVQLGSKTGCGLSGVCKGIWNFLVLVRF
jgi:hypothetical protein